MTRRSDGTFLPGLSAGKPKGTRNRLTAQFYEDVCGHWSEIEESSGKRKGVIALELLFRERPAEYCRLVASVLPKSFEHAAAELNLPDEELDDLIVSLRRRLTEQRIEEHIERPMLPVAR
jgi:hypothetical protein